MVSLEEFRAQKAERVLKAERESAIQQEVTNLVKDEKAKIMIQNSAQGALNSEAYQAIRNATKALVIAWYASEFSAPCAEFWIMIFAFSSLTRFVTSC